MTNPGAEARRIDLLEAAQQHLGRDVAITLMEMLPPSGSDVATQQGLDALEARMLTRFDAVDHRFEAIDHRFDAMDTKFAALESRFASVEVQMTTTFDTFRAEMRGGFADMQRRTIQWSVGTMIAMTTVLTAAFGVFSQLN